MIKEQQIKIFPEHLVKGDKIALISTARKISKIDVEYSVQTITNWGFEVVFGKNLFNQMNQFSGSDQQRSDDLQQMIDRKDIKAILCVRGGYGTVRIIDKIDFSSLFENPKWIVGYSDVTVLHSHLNTLGLASLHASMPINFKTNTPECLESIRLALTGKKILHSTKHNSFNRNGIANAQIVGGNLSILYSLCGSSSDINTNNKILFLEDLDEYLYHIDRMMYNLKRTGKLCNLAGLIIGSMSDMHDNTIPFGKKVEEIIYDLVKEYNYPVCFDFPAGHVKNNLCLPLGKTATLTVGEKTTLEYE
ncbi:MAG: S66 peptidase family protein [Flavobacteriales bacterium]